MTPEDILQSIDRLVGESLEAKGLEGGQKINRDTDLLDGSMDIDSLDLAGLIVQLEVETGSSPFEDGFIDFRTAGDLADLFAEE